MTILILSPSSLTDPPAVPPLPHPPLPSYLPGRQALFRNSALQHLDLSGSGVSASTCTVLLEALCTNHTLQNLVLQDNPLGASGARRWEVEGGMGGGACRTTRWGGRHPAA